MAMNVRTVLLAAMMFLLSTFGNALAFAADAVDIVVYGGTSSGIVAAIQAKSMGKSVVLIEPSNHLGGLTTGGLGATDIGNKQVIGGLARDFYHRIWEHYQNDAAWVREKREAYNARNPRYDRNDKTMWTFEPHVAAAVYAQDAGRGAGRAR